MTYIPANQAARQSCLDVLKCLAALFVVYIHYGPTYLAPIVRTAVPIFFIISGYYYPTLTDKGKFWKHFRKLLTMAIGASILYGLYTIQYNYSHGTLSNWIDHTFALKYIAINIATNHEFFIMHLWFFGAMIYDLLVLRLADRLGLTQMLMRAVPLLLCVFFVVICLTNNIPLVRNWLFMGLPLMMIGRSIRERESSKWLSFFDNDKSCLWILIVSFILVCIEFYVKTKFLGTRGREMYVFTIPLVLAAFHIALRHPQFGKGSFAATIGQRHSAYIYILHILVANIGLHILRIFHAGQIPHLNLVYPIIVFFVCLALSVIWLKAKKLLARVTL